MINRWLPARQPRYKRRLRSKTPHSLRLESLERRYCMTSDVANEIDTVPAPSYSNPAPPLVYLQASNAIGRPQRFAVICDELASFQALAADSSICLDTAEGPWLTSFNRVYLARTEAAQSTTATLNSSGTLSGTAYADNWTGQVHGAALDAVHGNSGADVLRPNLPIVTQRVVGEGEGPTQAVVSKPPASTETKSSGDHQVAKSAANQNNLNAARAAGFVTSIETSNRGGESTRNTANRNWTQDAPHQEVVLVSRVPTQSASNEGWTGLLADRAPATAVDLTKFESRPQLSVVPGRELTVVTKTIAEPAPEHLHLVNYRQLDEISQSEPGVGSANVPVTVASVVVESSQLNAETLVTLSPEESSDDKPSAQAAPTRRSRYWVLAAIPAFFIIPRRVLPKTKQAAVEPQLSKPKNANPR